MEEWKVVDEFPDYAVSNEGRVINNRTGYVLSPSKVAGFHVVGLRRNNRPTNYYVHRLVAEAFFGMEVNGIQVKHVNGNKDDSSIRNLRVDDESRVVLRGRIGRRVRLVETGQIFESVAACAKAIGGLSTGIYGVLNGRSFSYHGYHFRYVE